MPDDSVNLGDGKSRRTSRIQQLESLLNFGSGESSGLRKPGENEMLLGSRDGLRRKRRSVGYGEDANQAVDERVHHRNQRRVLDQTVSATFATINKQKRRTRGASFLAEFSIQMLPKHCGRRKCSQSIAEEGTLYNRTSSAKYQRVASPQMRPGSQPFGCDPLAPSGRGTPARLPWTQAPGPRPGVTSSYDWRRKTETIATNVYFPRSPPPAASAPCTATRD